MSTGSGDGVTGAAPAGQGRRAAGLPRVLSCCIAICLTVAACSQNGDFAPVGWWHQLQGGEIAQDRPPPPNPDAPFPLLGTVPTRPGATDAAVRGRIASGLIADRANAQYTNSLTPLPTAPPAARPVPPAPAPVGGDSGMSASLPAATAQPAPPSAVPTPPRRAPVGTVSATPLAAPALPPPAADAGSAAAPDTGTALPTIPAAPPPAPSIAGVPAATAPTPPPPTPPPAVVAPVVVPGAPVTVSFPAGSAVMPPEAVTALRLLAARRRTGVIAVTGYGEAAGIDPAAQSAALPPDGDRAQAIVRALLVDGVPNAALRITSEANGRGVVARIVD